MSDDSTKVAVVNVPVVVGTQRLPVSVERAGAAGRFVWEEFFHAGHHNPRTQKAYMAAVKRFLTWADRPNPAHLA